MTKRQILNMNEIYDTIYSLYKKYINNPSYVYTSCDDYIVIMKLLEDTKTNVNRTNVIDILNARHQADKLNVEVIFNKYNPKITLHNITDMMYKNFITYIVNSIVYFNDFDTEKF